MINQSAVILVGRQNPEIPGRAPFSPFGTGFCINPDGVVVTCWHTVGNLFHRYSLVEFQPDASGIPVSVQGHEVPKVVFNAEIDAPGELTIIPMLGLAGNIHEDIACVELGGRGRFRPLPFMPVNHKPPVIGEVVEFVAQFTTPAAPRDVDGQLQGWAITRQQCQVLHVEPERFFIDYEAHFGMSGAPVCNARGEVLGMIVERWSSELAHLRFGLRTPVSSVIPYALIAPHAKQLRENAQSRAAEGGDPWCSLPPSRMPSSSSKV